MAEATDIHGTVFKNGSAMLLARIVGAGGTNIAQADIGSVAYSVFLLDDQDPDARTEIDGHGNVALNVVAVLFNALQTDAIWTTDAVGYNFRHVLDVSEHPAFTVAGRRYLIEYRLTPVVGQVIVVRFRIHVI